MLELNESQKKKFLQFVTGTTRLPLGGDFFFFNFNFFKNFLLLKI